MFPEPEPSEHLHLNPHPSCICTRLLCRGSVLSPGWAHGMLSGRTFTWHYAYACPNLPRP
ncbi:hypothetical protein ACFVU0_34460 [Streptomyces sp. NPDC058122]|uniref:hypothetical protein n=1 Tax=Streptomyces sp. NPDC058122 TaxID=3346349 RepID=UPI0036F09E88